MKLIDKDALVAWAKETYLCENASMIRKVCYKQLLEYLNTLEVKEVDLKEYYHEFWEKEWFGNSHVRTVSEMMNFTAKHFFELGVRTTHPITANDIGIEAHIISLLDEWRFLSSTEAKYRCEAYSELLEWIKAEPEETENGINQTQKEKQ